MRAVQLREVGDPDVLGVVDVEVPEAGPGTVVVDVEAAGLNFIDTYQRRGTYDLELPTVLGLEGAGRIAAVGSDVSEWAVGDTVAWKGAPGSYAEQVAVPVDELVAVPRDVPTPTAAAVMLQGMTAHYLASSTYPLSTGDVALVHAGAGGVGLLLIQIAKRRGAQVFTTVSTREKEELARGAGADEVIRYTDVDVTEAVHDLTRGRGVHVVYDSVGAATFDASLSCLRPRGMLVLLGQSSGPVEPVDPQRLNAGGSLFLTRPTLGDYTATTEELRRRARDLFDWIGTGDLDVRVDTTFPLAEAAEAHRYIEARKTRGKVLLTP